MIVVKVFVLFLVVLLMNPALGTADEPFRFAVLCDSRGDARTNKCSDDNSGVSPALAVVVGDILERSKTHPIRLILFPGDMISGYLKRDAETVAECNRTQLQHWRNTVKPLEEAGMTLRVTMGNHDTDTLGASQLGVRCSPHARPYIPALDNFKVFKELLGDWLVGNPGPASDLGLTYSFDAGGCHFAMLAAYTMFQNNSFSNETFQWLEQDLSEASAKGMPLFVASHPPAFPGAGHLWDSLSFFDPDYRCDYYAGIDRRTERDRFWNVLKKHKVVAYLAGHEHLIQVQEVEGVWHVVSAGLTKRLYTLNGAENDKKRNTILYDGQFQNPRASVNWPWNGSKKSYWGWCLVTVDGRRITMDVYGSDRFPTTRSDLSLLKSFTLSDSTSTR